MSQTNSQELVLSSEQESLLSQLKASIPLPRQLSWLQLSNLKLSTEKQLEAKILELQQSLNGWDKMELLALQEAISKAKAILVQIPELRKSFTRYLDTISDQMMSIQKRAEGLEALGLAVKRELDLKIKKEENDNKASLKGTEASNFKAHVQNEYVRISSQYRLDLGEHVNNAYIHALDQPYTDDGLIQYLNKVAAELKEIKKAPPIKFNYTLHKPEELNAIHATIPAPNYDAILTEVIGSISERFKMYHQDRQNAELAKAQVSKENESNKNMIESQAKKDQAVNTLLAKGESVVIDTLPGAKKVKRKYVIVIQETPEDTKKIIGEFLAHWNEVAPKLKIKTWANLSIKQMAAALQEIDEQISGLVYQEVTK
jgi:hypothetical protein